jgi:hypothetical protein
MSNIYEAEAQDDFNRARKAAFFDSLFNLFSPEKKELLSLQEVREVLKPRGETYRGMKEVPIELIVGSEGAIPGFQQAVSPAPRVPPQSLAARRYGAPYGCDSSADCSL